MGNLTKNWSLPEFAVSDSFPGLATKIQFSEKDELKAFLLAQFYGETVQRVVGYKPTSLSGKRTEELNRAIHGGKDKLSGHLWRGLDAAWDLGFRSTFDYWKAFNRLRFTSIYGELIIYLRGEVVFNLHIALPSEKDDPSRGWQDTLVCVEEAGKREYIKYEEWKEKKGGDCSWIRKLCLWSRSFWQWLNSLKR